MLKLKENIHKFLTGEDGMESIEVALIIVLAIGLVATLIAAVINPTKEKINEAGNQIKGYDVGNGNSATTAASSSSSGNQ